MRTPYSYPTIMLTKNHIITGESLKIHYLSCDLCILLNSIDEIGINQIIIIYEFVNIT